MEVRGLSRAAKLRLELNATDEISRRWSSQTTDEWCPEPATVHGQADLIAGAATTRGGRSAEADVLELLQDEVLVLFLELLHDEVLELLQDEVLELLQDELVLELLQDEVPELLVLELLQAERLELNLEAVGMRACMPSPFRGRPRTTAPSAPLPMTSVSRTWYTSNTGSSGSHVQRPMASFSCGLARKAPANSRGVQRRKTQHGCGRPCEPDPPPPHTQLRGQVGPRPQHQLNPSDLLSRPGRAEDRPRMRPSPSRHPPARPVQRPVRTPLTHPPTHHPLPRTPCRLCQTACANGYGGYGLDSRWYFLISCQDERRRAVATFSTITDPRHLGAGRPRAAGKPFKKAGPVHFSPAPARGAMFFVHLLFFHKLCHTCLENAGPAGSRGLGKA